MNQLYSSSLFSSSSLKKFGMGITLDNGSGSVEASTLSFMDIGKAVDSTQLKTGTTKQIIQFDADEYYWKTPINGVWIGTQVNGKFSLTDAELTIDTGR